MPFQSRVRTIVGWRLAQLVKDHIEIPPPALPEPGVGVNALEPTDARIIVQRLPEDTDPLAPTVGRYSSLNWRAQLLVGGGHRADWVSTFNMRYQMGMGPLPPGMPTSKGPIVIGNDVWIGYEALVLSGVTIGDGAVVGARAVVTKDVEPYSVVVGSPAKHHHYRFDEPTREALLRIAWWAWPEDKVRAHVDQLNDADVARFVDCHDPATDRKRCAAC